MEFIETRSFTDRVKRLLSEDDYREFQNALIARPDLGDRIPGSGGLRKVRWRAQGKGKRGGARVIYFWAIRDERFLMLDIFGKGERADLSARDVKDLKKLVEVWLR